MNKFQQVPIQRFEKKQYSLLNELIIPLNNTIIIIIIIDCPINTNNDITLYSLYLNDYFPAQRIRFFRLV